MKVQIFGKSNCTYCEQAKSLLSKKDIGFEYKDFFRLSKDEQEEVMELAPSARTYPIIFVDHVYIGGFDKLKSIMV